LIGARGPYRLPVSKKNPRMASRILQFAVSLSRIIPLPCCMLAMTTAILVRFWVVHWATGHWATCTHTKLQSAALYCSLASWATLTKQNGYSGSCMVHFIVP
jgi:hypothetical protein